MNILFLSNSYWNLYKFRYLLINVIKKKNSVYLLANKDNFSKNFFGVKKIFLKLKKNNFSFISDSIFFSNIFKIIKHFRINLIISFTIKLNLVAMMISKIFNKPSIITISGLGTLYLKYPFFFKIYLLISKILITKKVYIFFHNKDDLKIFKKKGITKKCLGSKVIFGSGVNIKKFLNPNKINFKKNNFIFVGRLLIEKGIIELLDAIINLKKKKLNYDFTIVGPLDFKNPRSISQRKLFHKLQIGKIKYFEYSENIKNHFKNSSCLILPSYREGCSKAIMEAMTFGLPVITTNVPGCEENIKKSRSGIICKVKSVKSLQNSIKNFANLPISNKKEMSKNAVKYSIKNFDENKIVKKYIDAIKLIDKK